MRIVSKNYVQKLKYKLDAINFVAHNLRFVGQIDSQS